MSAGSPADGTRGRRVHGAVLALVGVPLVIGSALGGPGVSVGPSARGAGRGLEEPREIVHQGDFAHPAAGFPMPDRVGPFERVALTQYDEGGTNVSAGYNAIVGDATPLPIVATLYVYPRRADDELDAAFDRLVAEIGRHHGGARPEFRERIQLAGRFPGRYAGFGYAEPWGGLARDVPLRSYAVLYPWGSWWVKWRVTSPAPMTEERMRAIVELTEHLLPPPAEPEGPGRSLPATEADDGAGPMLARLSLRLAWLVRSPAPPASS